MKPPGLPAALDMFVSQLTVDPHTNMPLVILKDKTGVEALPIWIGLIEASAIASELEKITLDRPLTHDLMRNLLGECGATVERVEVTDVRDNTFYALIHLCVGERRFTVDSRPSDAIALALRTGAPISVARKVIDHNNASELSSRELLEGISDDEFGKWKM